VITKILDTYAFMAFFEDEPGADSVRELILDAERGQVSLAVSAVNLGELWYMIARRKSFEVAEQYIGIVQRMAIEIVSADWEVTCQAAMFKVNGNISYADCFTAALAKLRDGEVVTGDKEFQVLEHEIKIEWLA
jgi:ribonuclease VapC